MGKKAKVFLGVLLGLILVVLVADTVESTCYDDDGKIVPCKTPVYRYYDQDGNYNIHPTTYTKLDARGNNLPVTATSWVMVRDNGTGLIWEVKCNMDGVKDYNDPHDSDNIYTWYDPNRMTNGGDAGTSGDGTDTRDFIEALNNGHFGGYSNWRLPTIKELAYLVDHSIDSERPDENTLYINTVYFPNTMSSYYWSSTNHSYFPYYAWAMYFHSGKDDWRYKDTAHYVRAVRYAQ
jgi:hypothetical protein